jgi:hypothetical protein
LLRAAVAAHFFNGFDDISPDYAKSALAKLPGIDIVLIQQEIPEETVEDDAVVSFCEHNMSRSAFFMCNRFHIVRIDTVCLPPDYAKSALAKLPGIDIVLIQQEIPEETVEEVCKMDASCSFGVRYAASSIVDCFSGRAGAGFRITGIS